MTDLSTWLTQVLNEQERDGRSIDYLQTGEFLIADAAAKRTLIERYAEVNEWVTAGHYDEFAGEQSGLETALEILASTYADRPGYREAVGPSASTDE
jgi:hypothetical protein